MAGHVLASDVAKVWRAILARRTPVLGGHIVAWAACGAKRHVYQSCRNRHCPQRQTRARESRIAARRREVLPVPYFHPSCSLPHALDGWIAADATPASRPAVVRATMIRGDASLHGYRPDGGAPVGRRAGSPAVRPETSSR